MNEKKQSKNFFIAGIVLLCFTAAGFGVYCLNVKNRLDAPGKAEGKTDGSGFSDVMRVISNDDQTGSIEDNARYANISSRGKTIEIKEKMFIAQVNDVYLNKEDYIGRTVKLEGIFKKEQGLRPYYFVLRYGPGCCGFDGNAGFEVAWEPAPAGKAYPKEDDWVEARGIIKTYNEDDNDYVYIALDSLDVKKLRGKEFVSQ